MRDMRQYLITRAVIKVCKQVMLPDCHGVVEQGVQLFLITEISQPLLALNYKGLLFGHAKVLRHANQHTCYRSLRTLIVCIVYTPFGDPKSAVRSPEETCMCALPIREKKEWMQRITGSSVKIPVSLAAECFRKTICACFYRSELMVRR
ncbi:hypothetical protein KP509_09G061400 [Ceratopteris richardii]|uniref:Uncharacterized protein n=1 Tax=Ceratopteris richardii TaxID=49495 RepID=A0A8T2U6Y6_CERRI|nr:hypothetical protein KP509_09G061400 [Ceratopteris richardii]